MAGRLNGFSTAALSRLVAERVVDGLEVRDATLDVFERLRAAPVYVVPIGLVAEVSRREVDLEGDIVKLWVSSHSSIQQVGLLADGTGRIKFTPWKKSLVGMVEEDDRVRIRHAARNWYRGPLSVVMTGWSRIERID